ncbi:Glycerate dehydrogenase [Pleurostoma richardsiae]|uniref:Glycerate dehydrogenase n=1 Tax=Pleurostoma richardsiae TaxID=41990 RepID=A0AA38RUB9_9PEZI|nr:Glycerate dehydrogenase [Pleurostoma richardsiae]
MESILRPKKLPDETHEVIVVLEAIHVAMPEVDTSPRTHEVLSYPRTSPADDVAARVRDASIVIVTTCAINAKTLGEAPYLKCIISHPTGTDHIDLDECRRRNVQVMNSPSINIEAVSEHALALYFAARRGLVKLHNTLLDYNEGRPNDWKAKGSLTSLLRDAEGRAPKTCSQETVAIFGYGALGKRIAQLCRALGMKVIISARKDSSDTPPSSTPSTTSSSEPPVARVPFAEALRTATVLILSLPLSPSTLDLISAPELAAMRPDAVLVSVSRGGIVNEAAAAAALAERRIYGYATDVHAIEPAGSGADSALLAAGERGERERSRLNMTLTPHLAWFADTTLLNIQRTVVENVRAFVEGTGGYIVVKRT